VTNYELEVGIRWPTEKGFFLITTTTRRLGVVSHPLVTVGSVPSREAAGTWGWLLNS